MPLHESLLYDQPNFPSQTKAHRRADMFVHLAGLIFIIISAGLLIVHAAHHSSNSIFLTVIAYALCALISNLSSWAYHFSPRHDKRVLFRRIDHAAIYLSITGTFTPLLVIADTSWTFTLLILCWVLTIAAMANKLTNKQVKSKWSTLSYLALGALGLLGAPHIADVSPMALWLVAEGAVSYVIGVVFYARKSIPYRYAIWHIFVTFGGIFMFLGIWHALFN